MKYSLVLCFLLSASAQAGSFNVEWESDGFRSDGTPYPENERGGYKIYYGPSEGNYPNMVDIADPAILSATVDNVPGGAYIVTATQYDTEGRESAYAVPVVKEVPFSNPNPPVNLQ